MTRIDLQQFCSRDETRFYIMRPWRRGSWTYATDGHICVRVDAIEGDEEQPKAPEAEGVFGKHSDPRFAPLRVRLPAPRRRKCEACGGLGFWKDEPYTGLNMTCSLCDGEKTIEARQSVSIAGVYFQSKYIAQIAALPEAEFPTNPIVDSSLAGTPCPFRFAGGTGALMPMRSEGDVHLGDLEQFRVPAL
jgi:hypothetical protein